MRLVAPPHLSLPVFHPVTIGSVGTVVSENEDFTSGGYAEDEALVDMAITVTVECTSTHSVLVLS